MSMRWWLALVFGVIVAVTALAVGEVLTIRSERAFRTRAEELAAGSAVTAAAAIAEAGPGETPAAAAAAAAHDRRVALFLFGRDRRLLTAPRSNGVALSSVPDVDAALEAALDGRRLVRSTGGGRRIVVALPMRGGPAAALVAVAARPDLAAAGNILRGQRLWAILVAIALGALVGVVVAILITSRLRRIARASGRIAQGSFDEPLTAVFDDELGELARTVDAMRVRLRDSFASLEEERDRLRSLLEQLQEGVIAVDPALRIVFANSRAALLFGRRTVQPGADLPDPWGEPSLRTLASRLLAPDARLVNVRVSPDAERTYSVVGIPSHSFSDSALLVISDITAADRRETAEREFVANAAHELRTPLAAIAGAVEVLQSGARSDPVQLERFLGVIERQSDRLSRLVRSLLILARAQTRAEPLTLEPVDVAELLRTLGEKAADGGPTAVEVRCASGLTALAHPDLLSQAVGNLVANAMKHGDGERVLVTGSRAPGDHVRIEVRDYGDGIPDPERERVFDRFYRGSSDRADSFGLGLPIVREVAAALGGTVELEPADGGGTRVSITISAAGEA
jgi:signal transduction histidine kinase/HAMP domain-containing protein